MNHSPPRHTGQIQSRGNEGHNTAELLVATIASTSEYHNQNSGMPFYVSLQTSADGYIWHGGPGSRYRTADLIFLFPIPNMDGGYRPLPGQSNRAPFVTIDADGAQHGQRKHAA